MLKDILIYGMIYSGSALMAYNIYRYVMFARHIRKRGNWERERKFFNLPIVLLILFLAGYLAVGIFGKPDLVIAGILFGGSIFVLVMLIIIQRTADRIQENERLEAELLAADEANRAKTFFLSNMSHDIRTPLNAIIGYTTLAEKAGDETEKSAYLEKIGNAGRQLLDIVNDVLEMSRIESGRIEPQPEYMDIEDCVRQAAEVVRSRMEEKRIELSVSCNVSHRMVSCDRSLLSRALVNLLGNAGKFTEEGGKVELELSERDYSGGNAAYTVIVRDNGIGMDPEFVQHIFKPFERERTSTVSRIQGTGLGMAITHGIVEAMNGSIDVSSEKGKGTEFTVSLTLPAAEGKEEDTASGQVSGRRLNGRVLLVEDNEVNMEIAAIILEGAGALVERAVNGREAVEMVKRSVPGYYDAVLMDIQMPVMDGYTAAREIRALEDPELASVPVIAMTANAFAEDVQAAMEAGMNGHISKPIDTEEMMETLEEVFGKENVK